MSQPNPPDCFLLPDDTSALHTVAALNQAGLRVPGDVGVAGYDGQRWARALFPALSTFRQPLEAIGEAALERLLSPRNLENSPREIVISGALVPGETL